MFMTPMLGRIPWLMMLAQAGGAAPAPESRTPFQALSGELQQHLDLLARPDALGDVLQQINMVWSVIFIIVGGLCILHGYRWHKVLMVVLAAIAGVWAGTVLGDRVGSEEIAAVCLSVLFAVLAWPLMRYAVALFGGLAGAFAGANCWTAIGQDPTQHWVGAMVGLIIVGMLAFMAFRMVVVVLTTVGGASLLGCGAGAALLHVESWRDAILRSLDQNPLIFPIMVACAAALGAVFQFGGGIKGLNEHANKADPKKAKAAQAKAA